jgi:triosephosphate isomerase
MTTTMTDPVTKAMTSDAKKAPRRRVIAGNWKMYKTQAETRDFFSAFLPLAGEAQHCDVVIAPPFTAIAAAAEAARSSAVAIAGQDLCAEKEGAFTGQVSADMLLEAGARYVIVGHSERRQYNGETDELVLKKTQRALATGLTPIVCVGESLAEREADSAEEVLARQFRAGLGSLTSEEFSRILIAYEPVWAIGTGRTATPEIAAAAHRYLRQCAAGHFSPELAASLRILYGGSVKPDNIHGLMAQEELDGALVGGASLDARGFAFIVNFQK